MSPEQEATPPRGPEGVCRDCQQPSELVPPSHNPPVYHGLCGPCAWRAWFDEAGKGWDDVECVLCELGRRCPEHPEVDA